MSRNSSRKNVRGGFNFALRRPVIPAPAKWYPTRSFYLVFSVLSLAACSDASAPSESAVGVYSLETINGLAPPIPLGAFYNYTFEYTDAQLTISADKTYRDRSILTERVDGNVVRVDTIDAFGVWQQSRTKVVLTENGRPNPLVSTLARGKLTFDLTQDDSLYHYVYRKN